MQITIPQSKSKGQLTKSTIYFVTLIHPISDYRTNLTIISCENCDGTKRRTRYSNTRDVKSLINQQQMASQLIQMTTTTNCPLKHT